MPKVYSIAAHRGFADALAAGLIERHRDPDFGLARLTLLLPSQRAIRTVTEAFVRLCPQGMLLPRMAAVGDLDLDETLGLLLDSLAFDIAPAVQPSHRWLRLAMLIGQVMGDRIASAAARLRMARSFGQTIDRLLIEGVTPVEFMDHAVLGVAMEQAEHWRENTRDFLKVWHLWIADLDKAGLLDAASRRNALFNATAQNWRDAPPPGPIVAAGVTSAAPALAHLLRVIADLPQGAVVLPDLDMHLADDGWEALGRAGGQTGSDESPFGQDDAATHPQYHLKVLLNRMGVARAEVKAWRAIAGTDPGAAPPARSRAISSLFLPAGASAVWADLPANQRNLAGVRLMESLHPEAEAQAIAVLIRGALEVPERRAALITPSRDLAARVMAHLRRWDIQVDDTAGVSLAQTAAGRLWLLLAEVAETEAAPVALVALLSHPLVMLGEARPVWLEQVRALDLHLRGPRSAPGLAAIGAQLPDEMQDWWQQVMAVLAPLQGLGDLAEWLAALAQVAEALCGVELWAGPDGRALAAWLEDVQGAAMGCATPLAAADLLAVLRDSLNAVAVRPPWGGHPRVAIYGLLEARMTSVDLVICGGMTEGTWPGRPAPDPLLPPAVLRHLGVPGAEFRIGLAAHDLAGALGAPEVVLSWALRDNSGPAIPSRFILRVQALLDERQHKAQREHDAPQWARALNFAAAALQYPRPQPKPNAEQRRVNISATALDRLRSDPYQFYASNILGLHALDGLDATPSAAWQGTAAHDILDKWHKAGGQADGQAGALMPIAHSVLDDMRAHPLIRGLWRPRLLASLAWIEAQVIAQADAGRRVMITEAPGNMVVQGVRITAKADRLDRNADGTLAIVDYKTGQPPSKKMVQSGFALQLGLIGLIAEAGGFNGLVGLVTDFEYWSLARDYKRKDSRHFGHVATPFSSTAGGLLAEDFLPETQTFLADALDRWILGDEPFTARLNPDLTVYSDYDQLMRLDEWQFLAKGAGA